MRILFLILISIPALAQDWQQEVNYVIDVRLNDRNHELHGNIFIEYINHSPDDLSFIYFHLWPNGYRNNETALARQFNDMGRTNLHFAPDSMRGYIDSLNFTSGNTALAWEYDPEHIDICKVFLPQPLKKGNKITISTPFKVKIPGDFSRLGHVGQSYQISQWYPKPAVYDHKGWHPMPYLDLGEFYSEFGKFEVNITVPENYRVAATGILQNEDEKEWIDSLSSVEYDLDHSTSINGFPVSSWNLKTLSFSQDNIHDFAWFADKRYNIVKSEISLNSGKKVESYAFFTPESRDTWKNGALYIDSAIYYYSKWVGEYPYDAATAVEGALSAGGGMEYPMITVISAGETDFSLDQVITHEVGHNWFYGILASNERLYPWMDEGFNTFIEERYIEKRYPDGSLSLILGDGPPLSWLGINYLPYKLLGYYGAVLLGSYGKQVPINTPSHEMNVMNYGLNSYMHTGQLMKYLMNYLGEETMDKCMHAYFNEYKFKHPYPKDVKRVFEKTSEKDLSWWFDTLINTNRQVDYKVLSAKHNKVTIKNTGSANAPYSITTSDSTLWFEGHKGKKTHDIELADQDGVVLNDNYSLPDLSPGNNQKNGIDIALLSNAPLNGKKRIYAILPWFGYNTYDQLTIGAMAHNLEFLNKRFTYILGPGIGFGNSDLSGTFLANYDWLVPESSLSKIRLQGKYNRFAFYDKLNPSLTFYFLNNTPYKLSRRIELNYNYITTESNEFGGFNNQSFRLSYHHKKRKGLFNSAYQVGISYGFSPEWIYTEQNPDISLSTPQDEFLTVDFQGTYERKISSKSSISATLFTGFYLLSPERNLFKYTTSGTFDYAMDRYLLDRADNERLLGLGNYQVLNDLGTFRSVQAIADNWITTLNLTWSRKGIPLDPYLNTGLVDGTFYYEAGLAFNFGPVGIYLPLLNNDQFDQVPESFGIWADNIRFSINLGGGSLLDNLEENLD